MYYYYVETTIKKPIEIPESFNTADVITDVNNNLNEQHKNNQRANYLNLRQH